MMVLIQLCCCRSSLRSGSLLSAFYTMVYFAITIVMVALFGVSEVNPPDLSSIEVQQDGNDNNSGIPTEDPQTLQALNICVVTLSTFGLASTFLLIYGISKSHRECFIPWIAVVTGTTTVDVIYAVYLLFHVESLNPISAIVFIGDFILVFINILSILCVVSFFEQVKAQRSARRMVGLAVTDDFDTGQSQPVIEELKLAELAGSNSQSGGQPSQVMDVVMVETCCWNSHPPESNGTEGSQVPLSGDIVAAASMEEKASMLPGSRRVTFNPSADLS